jgi:hypothetical protein
MREFQSTALCFMFLSFAKGMTMKSADKTGSWVAIRYLALYNASIKGVFILVQINSIHHK